MNRFLTLILFFFKKIFGAVNYTSPAWFNSLQIKFIETRVGQWCRSRLAWMRSHPRSAFYLISGSILGLVLVVVVIVRTINYINSLPKPDYITVEVNAPSLPNLETREQGELNIRFSRSVAALNQLSKPVTEGVTLTPALKGVWHWESDHELIFRPSGKFEKNDAWGIGQKYTISFTKKFFPSQVLLKDFTYDFNMPQLAAQISKQDFYQDPRDPKNKRVVVNLSFNYPIDAEDFKKRVVMTLQSKDAAVLGEKAKSVPFSTSFGKFLNEAYISSDPLEIPKDDMVMRVEIDKGVHGQFSGQTEDKLAAAIAVPGMFNYFKFTQAQVTFARNERYEPEQVLILETIGEVSSEAVAKSIEVMLLPLISPDVDAKKNKEKKHYWRSTSEVTEAVKAQMTPVKLTLIPSEQEATLMHSFKVNMPVGRSLFVKVNHGLKSFGGYELAHDYLDIVGVPEYPKELLIMSQGSLLSLSGDKKIPLLGRNIHKVDFQISRILPAQLNQLIVQVYGQSPDFSHPNFDYFSDDTLAEKFAEKRTLKVESEAATQYFSFDLEPYLAKNEGNRRGMFYLTVKEEKGSRRDQRLILLTDLGVVVKETVAKAHDVFVQNLRTGAAVVGATVEVLGANGIAILEAKTGPDGRASFPDLHDFKNEKRPIAFVVQKDGDLSYLPYQMHSRELSFSQFDVGGIYENAQSDQLTAYLFSDRGIYRPGDGINLGLLVRGKNWKKSFKDAPITWSVTDPRGTEVHREKLQVSSSDLKSLNFSTQDYSPTGNYEIRVFITKKNEIDQQIGSLTVRVEEFLPDRMRITTHLSQERLDGWVSPTGLKGLVTLRNLFGTPAENRLVKGKLILIPIQPSFHSLKDYTFTEFKRDEKMFSEPLESKKTDATGGAEFDLRLARFDSGMYSLRFEAEGFEAAGGRGVNASSAVLVSMLPYLVGVKRDTDLSYLKKDSQHVLNLIAVDPKLNRVAATDLQVVLVERRFVSTLLKQNDSTYKYQSVLKEIPGEAKPFSVSEKGSIFALPTDKPGDFTVVFKTKYGAEVNKVLFTVVGEANLTRSLEKNAELQLVLNKKDFNPGEEIEMQIRAPYAGAGLITIERDKVFASKWFKTSTTAIVEKIKIPEGVEGNAYVNVTFLRAIDSREIFMSPLSFAVQPFSVSLDQHKTVLTLDVPERVRPGEKLKVRYSANHKTKIILYGVDEGILLVSKYKLPDPLTYFFQRRALQVKTFQILDLLLPEYSIVQGLSAPGGDAEGALGRNLNPFKRKTDKAVVFWSGVIEADPNKKEFTYEVPDYFNGTIKVMAVAATESAFGNIEKPTLVRGDFILTPNVPTFVAPGDEFELGVGVSNQAEGSGAKAKIKVELTSGEFFEVVGEAAPQIEIAEGHESSVNFRLKVKSKLGAAKVKLRASLSGKSAQAAVELSVRPATPYRSDLFAGFAERSSFEVPVPRVLLPEYRTQKAGLSPVPLLLAEGLKGFLDDYPYGCTEQLVSKGMPFVVLKTRPEFKIDLKNATEAFRNLLQILRSRQTPDGGFAMYNPNEGNNLPISLYVAHFLIEAKERGFNVPEEVLTRDLEFIQSETFRQTRTLGQARLFAYALYLQARSGRVPSNDLSFLRNALQAAFKGSWENDLAGGFMAATYRLLKQDDEAASLFRKIKLGTVTEAHYEVFYDGLYRDMALIYLGAKHFPNLLKDLVSDQALKQAMLPLNRGQYNTYAAAHAILAMDALVANASSSEHLNEMKVEEVLANGTLQNLVLGATAMPLVAFSDATRKVKFTVPEKVPTYYMMLQSGFDRDLPQTEIKQKIELTREFLDSAGTAIVSGKGGVKMGDELTVRLRLRSLEKGGAAHIVLVDLLPGGFETVLEAAVNSQSTRTSDEGEGANPEDAPYPEGDEGGDGGSEGEGALYRFLDSILPKAFAEGANTTVAPLATSYVDRREDRVVVYAGFVTDQVQEFTYKIKAVNQGSFIVPPPFTESMYDRSVKYQGLSGKINVEAAAEK